MVHDLGEVFRMKCVQNVEEVLSWWTFTFREDGREVGHELGVLLELGPERLDTELIIVGHGNVINLLLLHQLLSAGKDILKKVLVDGFLRRQVILDYIGIRDKTCLDLRCSSRYTIISYLDLTAPSNSWVEKCCMLRFFESI